MHSETEHVGVKETADDRQKGEVRQRGGGVGARTGLSSSSCSSLSFSANLAM